MMEATSMSTDIAATTATTAPPTKTTKSSEQKHQQPQSSPIHPYFNGIQKTLGPTLFSKIQSSKLLIVGAGGIGCELLKNLSLSGCTNLTVIDLDTIDVSNLNRQFLFRSHHVRQPKCVVAVEAVKAMTPETSIDYICHHGNVKEQKFGVSFFKEFDAVLNALDNMDARRHVNRLCLASSIPLIEAGTTGYLGQVTVIHKESETECYECQPKPTQKVYPICTIRSTPSLPVHTIVWAKELYKLTFSSNPSNSMLFEDNSQSSGVVETSTYMDIILKLRPDKQAKEVTEEYIQEYAYNFCKAFFHIEIQKQIDMDLYKTAVTLPKVLDTKMIGQQVGWDETTKAASKPIPPYQKLNTMDVWTLEQCITQVLHCFQKVYLLKSSPTYEEFDKDDDLAMAFVTATTNLRSHQFSISPLQSYYTAKGIAGNIIPAIATTNAIVAGLQVLQLFHILAKNIQTKCKYIYCLRDKTRKGYYLQPTTLPPANPHCFICQQARVEILIDVHEWTFSNFIQILLKKQLGFIEPSVYTSAGLIYEEGEDDEDDDMYKAFQMNLLKNIKDLPGGGIQHDSIIQIEDLNQDLSVDVCIIQKDDWGDGEDKDDKSDLFNRFVVRGSAAKKNMEEERKEDDGEDDVMIEEEDVEIVSPPPSKPEAIVGRKRSASVVDADLRNGEDKRLKVVQ